MKREIKFRAWDHEDEIMVYSDQENDYHFFSIENIAKAYRIYDSIDDEGRPEPESEEIEIMQYTGLKDKNGKEIYEGDILNHKTTFKNNMSDRRFQSNTEIEVSFKNGCFIDAHTYVNLYDKIYSIVSHKIDFEIIRNIHENPELI